MTEATDPDQIMAITTRMLVEHLGLSSCAYAVMDPDEDGFTICGDAVTPGSPRLVGHYHLHDFGRLAVSRLRSGLALVINDNLRELAADEAATYQAIGITATICMPLIKGGRLTALMAIHDRVPRAWTDYEQTLISEVTERCWAHIQRAQAHAEVREAMAALESAQHHLGTSRRRTHHSVAAHRGRAAPSPEAGSHWPADRRGSPRLQ